MLMKRWIIRGYATTTKQQHKHRLTCGLEIHAQLLTKNKLFSNSRTTFHAEPNSQVSFYDAALPGTQPIFNWKALGLALRAAVALDCNVEETFSFDRKHYFYGDQPAGYQITQHYQPFATDGQLKLFGRDGLKNAKPTDEICVRIKQIQIEQDTGKSIYGDSGAKIDLNRTNFGLIELVTEPDIPDAEAAGIFVRKLQALLKHLKVCSGELETGAMRVDVNVSVDGGKRCEIKNLFSTSAVVHAIRAEFKRQVEEISQGKVIQSETRGWDGKSTFKLRGKETTVDYRYMPDPELLAVHVKPSIVEKIRSSLPQLPDQLFEKLLQAPYDVPVVDARTIMNTPGMLDYYKEVFEVIKQREVNTKSVSNWIVHRLQGELDGFSPDIIPAKVLADIIARVEGGQITKTSANHILKHLISHPTETVDEIIDTFELGKVEESSQDVQLAIRDLCESVIAANSKVVASVKKGKTGPIKFLVGQVMRECQGRVDARAIEEMIKELCK